MTRSATGTPLRAAAPTRTVTAQYPIGTGIYGLPIFADFLLAGAPGFPAGLAIEVKWQQSPGSVDEKFPYLVHCIQACYPCPTVIVADGGGQRPGALAWLRGQCQGKLFAVYTLVEFLAGPIASCRQITNASSAKHVRPAQSGWP